MGIPIDDMYTYHQTKLYLLYSKGVSLMNKKSIWWYVDIFTIIHIEHMRNPTPWGYHKRTKNSIIGLCDTEYK